MIEYPHIRRQHIYREADTALRVLDVQIAPNVTVGYVMGVGDEVPQAIQQLGVKVEMIVYKGFGHGINKPRSMRAVMQHNLAWFNHYIFGDPLPDFTVPLLPKQSS